jgi:hypothetical protein
MLYRHDKGLWDPGASIVPDKPVVASESIFRGDVTRKKGVALFQPGKILGPKEESLMNFRLLPIPTLILVLALALVNPASVTAEPPATETIHETFSETEVDDVCGETDVPIQIEGKAVFHVTEFADGRVHVTGTLVGRFMFEVSGETFTGRFTQWFGLNANSKSFNETDTFSATGKGDEGSHVRIIELFHITMNANGQVTVEFETASGSCG